MSDTPQTTDGNTPVEPPRIVEPPAQVSQTTRLHAEAALMRDETTLRELPSLFTRNWWLVLLRGIVGVWFGVMAFATPVRAGAFLLLLFSSYLIVNGIFAFAGAITGGTSRRPWGSLLGEAVLSIAGGLLVLVWPGSLAVSLIVVFAFWSVLAGVLAIMSAVELRKEIKGEWLLALTGILSIAAGVLVALRPVAGMLGIIWMIGAYALATGVALIALSFRLRSVHKAYQRRIATAGVPQHA